MTEEQLELFRLRYNDMVKQISTNFKEIEELEKLLENNPQYKRLIHLKAERGWFFRQCYRKHSKENAASDPEKLALDLWCPSDIPLNETCGLYVCLGKGTLKDNMEFLWMTCDHKLNYESIEKYANEKKCDYDGIVYYVYYNLQCTNPRYLLVQTDAEEFEKNHKVIFPSSKTCHDDLKKEFYRYCLTMSPDEAADIMVNKYKKNSRSRKNNK